MVNQLEEKRKNRFRLLQALYEKTDGVPERHLLDIRDIGKELGIDPDIALDTFEYLKGEGLAKWMAIGGIGTITHWGIKEVEDALDNQPTAHFPANIVVLTNSPGANVVSNTGNTVFDQRGQHVKTQYNAAGDINFGAAQNITGFIEQLNLIKQEINNAFTNQHISELQESKAKTQILEAVEEAQKGIPDKGTLLTYLKEAKECLSGIVAIKPIVQSIANAYDWISNNIGLS